MSQVYLELASGNGYAIITNENNGAKLSSELEIGIIECLERGSCRARNKNHSQYQ